MLLRKEELMLLRKEQRRTITGAKTEIKFHVSFNELSRSRRILQFYRVTQILLSFYAVLPFYRLFISNTTELRTHLWYEIVF